LREDKNARTAREYLDEFCHDVLLTDRSVLVLYTRLWWESQSGLTEYFPQDRLCLSFGPSEWRRWRELNAALAQQEGERENGRAMFFVGASSVHLGQTAEANAIFQRLDVLNVGGYRRARSLLLVTDANGRPRQFSGEFRGRRRGAMHLAWCDELALDIPFNAAEHGANPRAGQVIGPFHVALNFRGPYAEPLYRAGTRSR
jgi:hypothetical protein